MPGVNPATYAVNFAASVAELESGVPGSPRVPAEPRPACYVSETCEPPVDCVGETALAIGSRLRRVRVRVAGQRLPVVRRGGRRVVVVVLTERRQTVRISARIGDRRVTRIRHVKACALPSAP
jgi:hypothetical protein